MITLDTLPFKDYNGDSATLAFPIPFPTFEVETLTIYVTDTTVDPEVITPLVNDVDFIASDLNVNGIEGLITLIDSGQDWIDTGLKTGWILSIDHSVDAIQPGDFRTLGNYSPITLEKTLDRFAMTIKAVQNYIGDIAELVAENAAAIVVNAASIATNVADILANSLRIDFLEGFLFSYNQALTPAGTSIALTNATINIAADKHLIFEYVAVRGSSVQYGRELISGPDPFSYHTLEKVGDIGMIILATTAGGIGQVRYTISGGIAGEISYRIYKYRQ